MLAPSGELKAARFGNSERCRQRQIHLFQLNTPSNNTWPVKLRLPEYDRCQSDSNPIPFNNPA